MTAPRTQLATVFHEVGGQDILWHIKVTPADPGGPDEPPEPAELEVTRAELLFGVCNGVPQRMDILDLLCEMAGGELPDDLLIELNDKLGDSE